MMTTEDEKRVIRINHLEPLAQMIQLKPFRQKEVKISEKYRRIGHKTIYLGLLDIRKYNNSDLIINNNYKKVSCIKYTCTAVRQ